MNESSFIEVVKSKDQLDSYRRSVNQAALDDFTSERGTGSSNITYVKPSYTNDNTPCVELIQEQIRPGYSRVNTISVTTIPEDAIVALDHHLVERRVQEMAAPLVSENLSEAKKRPKGEVPFYSDHIIFADPEMSLIQDRVDLENFDVDFMTRDLARSNNVPLWHMSAEVAEGVEMVQHDKISILNDRTEFHKIAAKIMRSIGQAPEFIAPLHSQTPNETVQMVDLAMKSYMMTHASLPAAVDRDLDVFYNYARAIEASRSLIGTNGQALFSASLRTDGYSFPSIITNIDEAVTKLEIGTPAYLHI